MRDRHSSSFVPGRIPKKNKKKSRDAPLHNHKDENGSMVLFYIEEREGLFGKELVAVKEEKYPAAEDGNMAFVVTSSLRNEQGASKRIVNYSVWPLEDGDIVTIVGEDE